MSRSFEREVGINSLAIRTATDRRRHILNLGGLCSGETMERTQFGGKKLMLRSQSWARRQKANEMIRVDVRCDRLRQDCALIVEWSMAREIDQCGDETSSTDVSG